MPDGVARLVADMRVVCSVSDDRFMLLSAIGICALVAASLFTVLCIFLLYRTVEGPRRVRAIQLQTYGFLFRNFHPGHPQFYCTMQLGMGWITACLGMLDSTALQTSCMGILAALNFFYIAHFAVIKLLWQRNLMALFLAGTIAQAAVFAIYTVWAVVLPTDIDGEPLFNYLKGPNSFEFILSFAVLLILGCVVVLGCGVILGCVVEKAAQIKLTDKTLPTTKRNVTYALPPTPEKEQQNSGGTVPDSQIYKLDFTHHKKNPKRKMAIERRQSSNANKAASVDAAFFTISPSNDPPI
jgi:hypothetical protein